MKKIIYTIYLLLPVVLMAQEMIVHGVIFNKKNREPLYDATVIIVKNNTGTHTDFEGKYVLNVTLNDTLVVRCAGMKTQKVEVNQPEMNIELDEIILKEEFGPPRDVKQIKREILSPINLKDIQNANNPKYHFKRNAQKNVFVIFVSDLTSYDFNKNDTEFQQNYNVKYSLVGNYNLDFASKYNQLTFKYLKKKYKKSWLTEVRKDTIGLLKE
jgi:hypothetical protein